MSMTRINVRSGMTLTEYLECAGPSVNKFVLHLPGCRPITVGPRESREAPLGESTRLLGRPADDWLCTEASFDFDGREMASHVWVKPRPPPAAPADVPID